MKKEKFTLIELIVVVMIILILIAMLIPVISAAKRKSNWSKSKYKKQGMSWNAYNELAKQDILKKNYKEKTVRSVLSETTIGVAELEAIITNLKNCGYFKGASIAFSEPTEKHAEKPTAPTNSLYDNWSQFTGNPKKLTIQQFEALYDANQISEFEYYNYKNITGNPQNLSIEEFNVLKKSKNLRLFKNKQSEINEFSNDF